MNELYKKLAIDAGLYVDFNGRPWPKNMIGEDIEGYYGKFAQAIVRECIDNLYLNGYDDAMTQLQKHFGIEE